MQLRRGQGARPLKTVEDRPVPAGTETDTDTDTDTDTGTPTQAQTHYGRGSGMGSWEGGREPKASGAANPFGTWSSQRDLRAIFKLGACNEACERGAGGCVCVMSQRRMLCQDRTLHAATACVAACSVTREDSGTTYSSLATSVACVRHAQT
eukprot:1077279-Rhodomonas_salina.1